VLDSSDVNSEDTAPYLSGKGILIYPDHKIKIGFLEDNKLVGEVTEIYYRK